MNREKELVKKTGIYALGNLGAKVLTYIMVLVYSYFITPGEMGYYDLVLTTISMIQPLVIFQINDGVYRFLLGKREYDPFAIVGTGLKILVLTTFIAESIFFSLNYFYHFEYAIWIGLYLCSLIFYVYLQDVVRGYGNSRLYASCGIINSFIMLICEVIGLIFLNLGVKALLISKVIANFSCIIFLLILQRECRISFSCKFNKEICKKLFLYSIPLVPNTICWWVVNASDRYVILYYLGASYNGIYSIATKFPTVISTLASIFYLAWQESAIKEYNSVDRNIFFSNIFQKYYKFLFSLCLCAIPATKLMVKFFVSNEYSSAWMYTGFLFLGAIFNALCGFLGLGYQISKETNRSLITTVFAAVLNLFINIILIEKIGLHAACLSTFSAYVFLFLIRLRHTKRYFQLNVKWGEFLLLVLLNISLVFITFIVDSNITSTFICSLCIGYFIYSNYPFFITILKH